MKNWIVLSLLCCAATLSAQPLSKSEEQLLMQISKGFSQVAKMATPAVVYIETQYTPKTPARGNSRQPQENPFDYFHDDFLNRFFGSPSGPQEQRSREMARGSGFIVSSDGYIMTNNHLVEKSNKVSITLQSGKIVPAKVIGTDPKTDLAILKIEESNLPFLNFGDSDSLEVGDWAIAIGNPFGLQATVTVGVVSAKGRSQLQIADFEDFIQTDAAINPGNSGGPLLNVQGQVIGVNTAIASASGGYMGIGFSIPSLMAKHIMSQLIKDGSVTRGFLGVSLQPLDQNLASFYHIDGNKGAFVADVVKGSPADLAGLRQEDVIVAYDGHPIENINTFRNAVSMMPPGTKLTLKVNREGKMREIHVKIASVPEEIAGPNSPIQKLGLQVQTLTPDMTTQLGYQYEQGVVITHVESGSAAALAGLRPGGVIVAVNRNKVTTSDEFLTAVNNAAKDGRVLLKVRQGETVRFVALHFD